MYHASMPLGNTPSPLKRAGIDAPLLHENGQLQPSLPISRIVRSPDGSFFALACTFPSRGVPGAVLTSDDNGETWHPAAHFGDGIEASDTGAICVTAAGTLVVAYTNAAERQWGWNKELMDAPDAKAPTYVVRSTDAGTTWSKPLLLHDFWTGALRDMIQSSTGRLVMTVTKFLHAPGRHGSLTYHSDDDGLTWHASNLLDIGGAGHHDGITEATIIELHNGHLLQYLRTNHGQFWRAVSTDMGSHWHLYGPSGIPAGSAPGYLERLADGRLALVWNRNLPEGETDYPTRGGDCVWAASPAHNFRLELSLSFSADDGLTWSPPVVIAKHTSELSYPYLFEPQPGRFWISTGRGGLRMQLDDVWRV